ncbi:uncharacterized protein HHUB_2305 [Halobacterium hubeiense]|uniref:Uncharacterized protein n=1 Tax=Halobacterium hubeiense TaxID=1407499 RepID=A0A0U5CXV7_9EURY|nr:uncharacterized protein HHUB_2305 [Halobacterium hubeiense]
MTCVQLCRQCSLTDVPSGISKEDNCLSVSFSLVCSDVLAI